MPSAHIEAGAIIEAGAVIGPRAAIGSGTVIAPNAVIGQSCQIGRDGYIGPGVSVQYALIGNRVIIHGGARIGQDGFGFVGGAKGPSACRRSAASSSRTMSRSARTPRSIAAPWPTRSSARAPRSTIWCRSPTTSASAAIASSPGIRGISGSVTVGDGVMMGGGVGLADHVTIGSGAKLAARSGFMSNVPAGEIWGGYPAQPMARSHARDRHAAEARQDAQEGRGGK